MTWTANPGHAPKFRRPIRVKWATGKVDGPFERSQWAKFNWSLDSAMPIEAVEPVK